MSPLVSLNNSTHSSIEVVWHGRRSRKQPLLGHTVHYRREHGQWEQLVHKHKFSLTLQMKLQKMKLHLNTRGQFHQHVYVQLLCMQIPKAQKRQSTKAAFCAFGICMRQSCTWTCWWNWPLVEKYRKIFEVLFAEKYISLVTHAIYKLFDTKSKTLTLEDR